ncbi:MAG TPA: ATP-binding protein [Gemmatimonadaceae bacterium]|nr:ATP-binding protein [Gemmatimonadaceae bacterium]
MTDPGHGLDPLLDEAPCGFVSFVDDGTLRAINRTLRDILGYDENELAGKRVESLLAVGSRIFYQTHFFPLLRLHGRVDEVFLLLQTKHGDDIAVLANAARRERNGEWLTSCVVIQLVERRKFEDALLAAKRLAEEARASADMHRHDVEKANEMLELQAMELEVSHQQLLEQATELERQRLIADEANQAKSSFLAMMSHELRTPLNAIGGYVQLLEMGVHGPVNEAQLDALGRVTRSQRHLLRLINNILNLARIEAGHVDYDLRVLFLRDIMQATLPMIEPQLAARRLQYRSNVPAELSVLADREKVEQILLNLLSNASKFTPADGIVSVEAAMDPLNGDRVLLAVKDTGVGIANDQLENVFAPFVQVDVSPTKRAEGTGLGLAISRDLARGMGGDLWAASEVGAGSTFTLALPRA